MQKPTFVPLIEGAKSPEPSRKIVTRSGLLNQRNPAYKAESDSTDFTYELTGVLIRKSGGKKENHTEVSFKGSGHNRVAGAPDVPQEGIFIAIPANAVNPEVCVKNKKTKPLEGKYEMLPVPRPTIEIEFIKKGFEYYPSKEIYSKNADYPGIDFEFAGIKEIDGILVAHIVVYPVQFNPVKGQVTVTTSIDFEIKFELKGKPKPKAAMKGFAPVHADMIVDFEHVFPVKGRENTHGGEAFENGISKEAEWQKKVIYAVPYALQAEARATFYIGLKTAFHFSRLIIITTPALVNAVEPYRSAKAHAPYYATTITTDAIIAAFPAADVKESIKTFLAYAYSHWIVCPQFVVLAGDTDIIPMHVYARSSNYPSDHYYSDINGDMCPEIVVSRFPSSDYNTVLAISNYCAKYVSTRGADWQGGWLKKALFVAYELPVYTDCMDDIYNDVHERFSTTKLYGGSSSVTDVKNNINGGDLVVHYRGHGSQTDWSSANGLATSDIHALADGATPPLVFNICCENGWVDDNSLETVVEAFIRSQKAIATMGATRDSWTSENNEFSHCLWDSIMEGETISGRIFLKAKTKLVLNSGGSAGALDNLVQYNLFGDPTAPVISSADWLLGTWKMDHDGWKGTLNIQEITVFHLWKEGSCFYTHWHWRGIYTGNGKTFAVTGILGGKDNNDFNPGCKQSHHKIEFHIPFDASNFQKFSGYVFTWEPGVMAGLTWWENHPYGWYAKR